jgi:hypothetical protein
MWDNPDYTPIFPGSDGFSLRQRVTDAELREINVHPEWSWDANDWQVLRSNNRKRERREKPALATNWITHLGDGVGDYDFMLRTNLDYVQGRLKQKSSDANDRIRDLTQQLRSATVSGVEAQRWMRQQRTLRRGPTNTGRSAFEMFAVKSELESSKRKCLALKKEIDDNLKAISWGEARCKWLFNCVHNEWSDTDYDDSGDDTDGGQC